MNCPYVGWGQYFPDDVYDAREMDDRSQLIEQFHAFFKQDSEEKALRAVDWATTRALVLNFMEVRRVLGDPAFGLNLRDYPDITLGCIGVALVQALVGLASDDARAGQVSSIPADIVRRRIAVRVVNYDGVVPFKALRTNVLGRFVAIRGTVVRTGSVKPMVQSMEFRCVRCDGVQRLRFQEGLYVSPTNCPTKSCRSRQFEPDRSSAELVDSQSVRLQEELAADDHGDVGRVPATVDVEVVEDLVLACVPGDIVTVCGIVKAHVTQGGASSGLSRGGMSGGRGRGGSHGGGGGAPQSGGTRAVYVRYIDAISIENVKQHSGGGAEDVDEEADMSLEDLYAFHEIARGPEAFAHVVRSIAPNIFGHELVKAGLALSVFGGCSRRSGPHQMATRGDSHLLIVGDPGLGKSNLLQSVSAISPRGVLVCGSYASSSGLTVTLSRESGGDFAIEAGALVLADQGVCCIDEFDKMAKDHTALLEAMEQQTISIAKAGIVCSLPSRTTVIAAANPVGGHFNASKTVSENLRLHDALLSRFDLVYVLLDTPDREYDRKLSEHVMALHRRRTIPQSSSAAASSSPRKRGPAVAANASEKRSVLEERLANWDEEANEAIPPFLLRKYIRYARRYVHPVMSKEAKTVIQTFYVELRQKLGRDTLPITTRQLESLMRLAEARARLELRPWVSGSDAEDVVEIFRTSLAQSLRDEFGRVDNRRSHGMSRANIAKTFIAALQRVGQRDLNYQFSLDQMRQIASDYGLQVEPFSDFIDNMNHQGYLLKKGFQLYELTTV